MNKLGMVITLLVVVVLLTVGVLYLINGAGQGGPVAPSNQSSTASNTPPTLILGTPTGTASDTQTPGETISDGTITFPLPSDFGLATDQEQILVRSYIPPCDPDFVYCLYYDGTTYQGTNFDSAGIRIDKRTDLTTQSACLTTPPTGYSSFTPTTTVASNYSISEFGPLGDAGAGHYSTGMLYRVSYNGTCYEFETRIGQSQFANYPSGTIQQFTATDQASLQSEIRNVLNSFTLPGSETIAFPTS